MGANLRARAYHVLTAEDGRSALKVFDESAVDLIILDIMMPGPDGFEVCEAIRRRSDVPIIMLSARGQERDVVRALDLGGDDYLTKPFAVEELLARVRAALRRTTQTEATPGPPLIVGDLEIDFAARRVTVRGQAVQLTRRVQPPGAPGQERWTGAHALRTIAGRLGSRVRHRDRVPVCLHPAAAAKGRARAQQPPLHTDSARGWLHDSRPA